MFISLMALLFNYASQGINEGNQQKRYKGVAKVTSRRARKGFMLKYNLKYNPDAHWSAAFYRNLKMGVTN